MPDPVTADQIREASDRVRELERAHAERNEFFRRAVLEGWTDEEVAEASGLTDGRVNQIVFGLGVKRTPGRRRAREGVR